MKYFSTEKEMQNWLSQRFKNGEMLSDMIINYEEFKSVDFNESIKGTNHRKILDSFLYCLKSFDNNDIITENIDISMNSKDILKPDFIIFAPETQSIIIIELKNIKEPTRQVGTEIGAYAAEVRTYLPYLSEGDIINVIISTEWPSLLRHYVYNEIAWLNKRLICLEPQYTSAGIDLRIINPMQICNDVMKTSIWARQLGGYQLCLYDDHLYSGGDFYRIEDFEESMFTALHAMSSKGNALKAHGFAFLWRHCFKTGLAPYNITIINYASFQNPDFTFKNKKMNTVMGKKMRRIIRDHAPEGHGETLNAITTYGEQFLEDFCSPRVEGFESWNNLRQRIFHNTDAIAFVGWGLFQDHFFERIAKEPVHPESGHRYNSTDPMYAIDMLNEIISDTYPFIR